VKIDSLGNVTEKKESGIIFNVGNPLNWKWKLLPTPYKINCLV
jgi:hypothetical protein